MRKSFALALAAGAVSLFGTAVASADPSPNGPGQPAAGLQHHADRVLRSIFRRRHRRGPTGDNGSRENSPYARFLDAYLVTEDSPDAPPVGVVRKDRNVWKMVICSANCCSLYRSEPSHQGPAKRILGVGRQFLIETNGRRLFVA